MFGCGLLLASGRGMLQLGCCTNGGMERGTRSMQEEGTFEVVNGGVRQSGGT